MTKRKLEADAANSTHTLTKEKKKKKSGVDIRNIPAIPVNVGERDRGLHATGSKWHLIMTPPQQSQKTLLRFTCSNIC